MNVNSTANWFHEPADASGSVRLFCFPYAGGGVADYAEWQAELGPDVEVCALQLPGRGRRLFEEPFFEMEALAESVAAVVAQRLDKPFVFFGHSMGALLAFEVARIMRRKRLPQPERLWVSGAEGPRTRALKKRLHDLPDAELIAALRDYNGTPAEVLDDPEMMELLLPGIRADFAVVERYRYRAEAPLSLPIHVVRGDADPYVDAQRAAGWGLESTHSIREHVFAGDHFFVHPHRTAITALLSRWLDGAYVTSSKGSHS